MGKYTPAQIRSKQKWLKENREQLNVSVPIGTTDKVHESMKKTGESKNKFVYLAIEERIARLNETELSDEMLELAAGGIGAGELPTELK